MLGSEITTDGLRIQVAEEAAIPALNAELVRQGAQVVSLTPRQISLEDVYFKLQNESNGQPGVER